MYTTEIDVTRNVEKGQLQLKFAHPIKDNQVLEERKNEVRLERVKSNLSKTEKDIFQSQTPAPWFNDWGIYGGEKRRIGINQSEANSRKQEQHNVPAFLF